jgi:hypothetical protein
MCEGEGEAHFNIGTDDLLGSGGCCELAKMVNRYWDVHTYTNRGERFPTARGVWPARSIALTFAPCNKSNSIICAI